MKNIDVTNITGTRGQSGNQQLTPSNQFGNKIKAAVAPSLPTADAFGGAAVAGKQALGNSLQKAGNVLADLGAQQMLLQQAEEKSVMDAQKTDLTIEYDKLKNDLNTQAYQNKWSSEELGKRIQDGLDGLIGSSNNYEYKTYIGDYAKRQFSDFKKEAAASELRPDSVTSKYRTDRITTNVLKSSEDVVQYASAVGTLTASAQGYDVIRQLYNDPQNVIAMGGLEAAETERLKAVNKMYDGQIHIQIQKDPALVANQLMDTKGNQWVNYPDLDPTKRNKYIATAMSSVAANYKKQEGVMMLEHAKENKGIAFNNPKLAASINEEYKVKTREWALLPTDERYATIRNYVNQYNVLPKDLVSEITNTANSQNPDEAKSAYRFVGALIDDNPEYAKQLPKDTVASAVMLQAGATPEEITKASLQIREMPVGVRDNLESKFKADIKDSSGTTFELGLNANADNAASEMPAVDSGHWYKSDYKADKAPPKFAVQYATLMRENYVVTNGNMEAAKKLTNIAMSRTWSTTLVNGKPVLMQYAPETMVSGGDDKEWVQKQLVDDIQAETGMDLSNGYSLLPTADLKHGGKPSYTVMAVDENGFSEPVIDPDTNQALVWSPDYTQTADYKQAQYDANERLWEDFQSNTNKKMWNNYVQIRRTEVVQKQVKGLANDIIQLNLEVKRLESETPTDATTRRINNINVLVFKKKQEWEGLTAKPEEFEVPFTKESFLKFIDNGQWVDNPSANNKKIKVNGTKGNFNANN